VKAVDLLNTGSPWALAELAGRFARVMGYTNHCRVVHDYDTYLVFATQVSALAFTARQVAHYLTIASEDGSPLPPFPVGDTPVGRAIAHIVDIEHGWPLDLSAGSCTGAPVKRCPGCGCDYDAPHVAALPWVGVQFDIALRNCRCGSTLADPTWVPGPDDRVGQ
jgi:hypothetical protein